MSSFTPPFIAFWKCWVSVFIPESEMIKLSKGPIVSEVYITIPLYCSEILMGGCGSEGRVDCPLTWRLAVQSQLPLVLMSVCPWARHLTVNCGVWSIRQVHLPFQTDLSTLQQPVNEWYIYKALQTLIWSNVRNTLSFLSVETGCAVLSTSCQWYYTQACT